MVALTMTQRPAMTMLVTALALGTAVTLTLMTMKTVVALVEASTTTMMMTTTSHPAVLAASAALRTMMASTIRPSTGSCRLRAATNWNQPVDRHVVRERYSLPADTVGR